MSFPAESFCVSGIENRLLPGELILLQLRQFIDAAENVLLLTQFVVEDCGQAFDALCVLRRGRGILGHLLRQSRQILGGGREFLLQVLHIFCQLFRRLRR